MPATLITPTMNANNSSEKVVCTAQHKPINSTAITSGHDLNCDVLIIGAGLAGISVALSLPETLKIIVLAKEDLSTCSSHYAQGGIAACIDDNDSVAEHVNDTLIAGDGLCDKVATTEILSYGSDAIDWLTHMGVPFTTEQSSTSQPCLQNTNSTQASTTNQLASATLHLTREGGHSQRRVVHADDATGRHIMYALHQRAKAASHISLLCHHEALRLLHSPDDSSSDNKQVDNKNTRDEVNHNSSGDLPIHHCRGAQVYDHSQHTTFAIHSHATVLASGGLGQLFKRATAPSIAMGDGIMMAWEAGCRLANLEFIQFHPTGLAKDDSNFLISEAVRGEGGLLRCPITGKRFMPEYDKRAELAPRDIVARAIANEISKNKLGYVHLDITHLEADFIQQHFPDIYAHCRKLGIDMSTQPIPVAPTAHYTCGGVMTTSQGQTDINGLYAVGEVAHTGLHGANRLASNSLLECVVVGRSIAQHLPRYLNNKTQWLYPTKPAATDYLAVEPKKAINTNGQQNKASNHASSLQTTKSDNMTTRRYPHCPHYPIETFKNLMTSNMGIIRSQIQLQAALQQIQNWQQAYQISPNANQQNLNHLDLSHLNLNHPDLSHLRLLNHDDIKNTAELAALRWQRLLNLATLLLQSALTRLESRGGHYRHDYPNAHNTALSSIVQPI